MIGAVGVAPATASAAPLLRLTHSQSLTDSASTKTASAHCWSGGTIIGGGGGVYGPGASTNKPTLSGMRPMHNFDGIDSDSDSYDVTAAETTPGTTGAWRVEAYAICAEQLAGVHLVSSPNVAPSSASTQVAAAVCPPGERVMGAGAQASTASGQVVLQVARPSASGDIVRAQAHEDADGYAGAWSVRAYAACAPPPAGYQVVFAPSQQTLSEPVKLAVATCPAGKRLLGTGAALSSIAPGQVSLQSIVPSFANRQTLALGVENTATPATWDFIVSTAICAT